MNRWTEHFKDVLNKEHPSCNDHGKLDLESNIEGNDEDGNLEMPTYEEVEESIKKLKNGRASGEDHITPEMIKYGGKQMAKRLHELTCAIWKEDWETGICPIFKNGDKLDCNNYRGITLLDVAYKVFFSILNERLKKMTENVLGDYQCGFHKNRSTSDQIFIIRQMIEKHYEHNQDLYMLFVDFKQAFDSIDRYKLYQVMEDMKIPHKLIRLVRMTMKNTTARVRVTNKLSNSSTFNAGVR